MDVSQIVAVAVFVVVMITIMTEKLHRSLAAITGAMIVLALHVICLLITSLDVSRG